MKEYHRCVCWAHIRRYLLEAIPKGHEKDYANPAVQGVLYCNKLFEYERSYKEKGISYDYRQKRRLKDEKPVIEGFLSWIDKQKAERGSRFERALTYIQNRRNDLMTYLEDGHCSLCNNASEQSIRPVTIGRKNYLFSDTQAGADASMAIYSLIETAKAQGLNPKKYLSYLLKYRPSAEMSQEELLRFAPWNETVRKACCNDIASDVE